MSDTANIELARRLLAAFAAGDDSELETIVARVYRDHARSGVAVGADGLRESLRALCATFAERAIEIEDLIAAGDRVAARVRFSATHAGELAGIAATGRRVETEQVHIWRIAGGRLAEHWAVRDDLTALRQIGARVEPAR
jgi:steroid delta-isomerase-like uncharacterized protein